MSDHPSIRHCSIEDARGVPGLTALAATPAPGTRVLLFEDPGDAGPRAAAILDLHGGPTEPDAPCLVIEALGPGGGSPDPEEVLAPLVAAGLALARADGHDRVITGCDPMDLPRLRVLERLGFAPTGRQPYFRLGGNHVEYVMGYADASGAIMDLVATPEG